jgi:hypothetical protein
VDHVKVVVPTPDGSGSEGAWAEPVDVSAGHYRIDNVLFFADGVSLDDLVRCEPNAAGDLIAVEVVRRSSNATLAFSPDDDAMDRDGREAACRRLISRIADRHGDTLSSESGMGFVAVCAPPDLVDGVLATVATEHDPDGTVDHDQQRVGRWRFYAVAHPAWEVPSPIEGADELLAEPAPEIFGVDWPKPNDDLVAAWPPEFVDLLRSWASTDERMRDALDRRLYVQAVGIFGRNALMQELGGEAVGPAPFRLLTTEADDSVRQDWLAAHIDGQVRWCRADGANERMRSFLDRFGLDPDADPYRPVEVGPS